jgi:hypothetical protein
MDKVINKKNDDNDKGKLSLLHISKVNSEILSQYNGNGMIKIFIQ